MAQLDKMHYSLLRANTKLIHINGKSLTFFRRLKMKPGYKTTEFWVAVGLCIIGILMSAGIFEEGDKVTQIFGFIIAAANGLGYSISRGLSKLNYE